MKNEEDIMGEYEKKCAEHPEYTEAQKECLMYSLYTKKACEVTPERISQKKRYNKFVCDNPTLVGFSEKGLRPLTNEQDPEIMQKVLSLVAKGGERKQDLYGTERKMKAAIARFKDVEPEKPKEKKLWNKVEQMEYTVAFVKTMYKNGVESEVIAELVTKALYNYRPERDGLKKE